MKSFFTIIKFDYLQRTRSYAFLITLCASLAVAYTFIPEPNANYSTIRIGDYVGYYNSAWFGYVTAIMTSVFLSLIGFYLVNSGIKTDSQTRVGQIIATTQVKNITYLFAKTLSNYLVLITIVGIVIVMSVSLFFLYNDGFPLEPIQLIKPYLIITLPALFVIAVLAVAFEVFLGRYSVIQNIGFFFLFSFLMSYSFEEEQQFSLDLFGTKIVTHHMEKSVLEISQAEKSIGLNIGYVIGNKNKTKRFEFKGVDFPTEFLLSRLIWMVLGLIIIASIAPFFHRFNLKERTSGKTNHDTLIELQSEHEIDISNLAAPQIDYGIFPLFKTESLLLIRKGKKWLWLINAIGFILLATVPIKMAHQIILPILWFLQVGRLSDLTTKEATNNVSYFAFTSYKPIGRLLVSQLLAVSILMLFLALPIIVRLALSMNFTDVFAVLFGGLFVVALAGLLGMLSNGKKLFEVLFFMITYANINGIPEADYFGGFDHGKFYLIQLLGLILVMVVVSVFRRKMQLEK